MFSKVLEELMENREISITDLSKGADIPKTTISGWLNAGRKPDYLAIQKLSGFFGVSCDYLLEVPEKNGKEYGGNMRRAIGALEDVFIDSLNESETTSIINSIFNTADIIYRLKRQPLDSKRTAQHTVFSEKRQRKAKDGQSLPEKK